MRVCIVRCSDEEDEDLLEEEEEEAIDELVGEPEAAENASSDQPVTGVLEGGQCQEEQPKETDPQQTET